MVKKTGVFLLLLAAFVSAGCFSPQNESSFDISSIKTYHDIPGITEQEIAAIEALKSYRGSFFYGSSLTTESFILPDGTYSGFTSMFCELLTSLFAIPFVQESHGWDSLMEGFNSLAIDFTGDLTPTPQRTQIYYMSTPIAERSLTVFIKSGGKRIKTSEDINGLTIGFFAGTVTEQLVRASYPALSFHAAALQNSEEIAKKLFEGEIDAFIADSVVSYDFIDYDFIHGEDALPFVYTPVSLSTANPDLEPVISAVNKYLQAGGIDELYRLYANGEHEFAMYSFDRFLSDDERAYITDLTSRGAKVPVALETDNYPLSFYNREDKEFQGIAPEILDKVSVLSGIEFEVVNAIDTPWGEILQMLETGKAALVSDLAYTPERGGRFLWSEHAIAAFSYALLSKTDYPDLRLYQIIRETVGIEKSTSFEDVFKSLFPNHEKIIYFPSTEESFDALKQGKVNLLMSSEAESLTLTNYYEQSGYKANIIFPSPVREAFLGFNINEVLLRSIVDKAMSLIDIEAHTRDWKSRTFNYERKYAEERSTYLGVFSAVLAALLIVMAALFIKNIKTNARLEEARKLAEQSNLSKSTFLAQMSHEIRTPMNAIIGMTSIGMSSGDPERREYCFKKIEGASKHLLGVINDILDMSKIEANKLELSPVAFSFEKLIQRVTNVINFQIDKKEQKLEISIDSNIPEELLGDDQRLAQVITNLLSNAVKFTPEGGRIYLNARLLEEVDSFCTLQVEVRDTGIGISPEKQNLLFHPFQQVDSIVARKFEGTGLGLAISKRIVELMDGNIWVSSEPGKGSAFTFTFLMKRGKGEKTEAEESRHQDITSIYKGRRVLLVEDMEINREIVIALLEPTLLEIDCAENGSEAVRMFSGAPQKYDLIFMDVQMPEMDGYEATRQIRAFEAQLKESSPSFTEGETHSLPTASRTTRKQVPIIAMTANVFREDIEKCLDAGMSGHVGKPLVIEEVLDRLYKYL
jgi:signal transduction histidine kinase/CheY-like chemotaxis protein